MDHPSIPLDTYNSWNAHGPSITPSTGSSTLASIGNNKFIVRKALPEDLDAVAAVRASSFSSQVLKDNMAKYQTQQLEDEFKDAVEKRFELKKIEILVALESSADGLSDRVVGTADVEFMPRRRAVFWDPEELPPRAYVSNMSVLPDYRRNGIGRALLQGAEAIAVQEGVDALYLHVMEDNDAARIAYERSGFSVDKIEQPLLQLLSVPRRIRMFKQAGSS